MQKQENQQQPLSLLFLKSLVFGMGVVMILGFTLVVSMILLGMKYFTDVRSCDKHPSGDIMLQIPAQTKLTDIHIDCGVIKATNKDQNKVFGFEAETGKLLFTIHTQNKI